MQRSVCLGKIKLSYHQRNPRHSSFSGRLNEIIEPSGALHLDSIERWGRKDPVLFKVYFLMISKTKQRPFMKCRKGREEQSTVSVDQCVCRLTWTSPSGDWHVHHADTFDTRWTSLKMGLQHGHCSVSLCWHLLRGGMCELDKKKPGWGTVFNIKQIGWF